MSFFAPSPAEISKKRGDMQFGTLIAYIKSKAAQEARILSEAAQKAAERQIRTASALT